MSESEEDSLSFGDRHRHGSWWPLLLAIVVLATVFGITALISHPSSSSAHVKVSKADWSVSVDHVAHHATVAIQLRNTAGSPVKIVRVGRSDPGLHLLDTRARPVAASSGPLHPGGQPLPIGVDRGGVVVLTLVYDVPDCHGLKSRPAPPIPVTYRSGSDTKTLMLDPQADHGTWRGQLVHKMCHEGWFSYTG